jgi:hypothetical protein
MFQNKLHKNNFVRRHYVILGSKINACEEYKRGHSNSFHLYKYVKRNTALSYVIFFVTVTGVVF